MGFQPNAEKSVTLITFIVLRTIFKKVNEGTK